MGVAGLRASLGDEEESVRGQVGWTVLKRE